MSCPRPTRSTARSSVWENLYFHGRFFGMIARAREARGRPRCCEQFRLADRAKAPVAALSGGMAQRLMVARAIMHRPATLFLDEPTAGLDPQSRLALWEILGELHTDGQTILLTTHYMEEADQLCDRLAIIDHGRLLALGTPGGAQALDRSRHRGDRVGQPATSTRSPRCSRPRSPARSGRRASTSTVLVEVRAQQRRAPVVFNAAERNGFDVTDLSVTEPTLETVFINLTGKDLRE